MAKSERIRLITPMFRVIAPDVFVKRIFQGRSGDSERYACTALFSGFEVINGRTSMKPRATWPEKDQAQWSAIIQACNEVAIEAFKKPIRDLDRTVYELPFHCGEEKEEEEYGPGVVYFTMSGKRRPCIIAREGTIEITQYRSEEFYAGCYARASVAPFANRQWKSLTIGLNNLLKLADGPRLDVSTSVGDDFGADASEFDAWQQKWT